MRSRSLFVLPLLSLLSVLPGCKAATDANTPCFLVGGLPDGGRKGLTEFDLSTHQGQNHDFISFGSVECDDQICVRDSAYSVDGGLGSGTTCSTDNDCRSTNEICSASGSGNPPAHRCSPAAPGYCSHPCIAGQTCPSGDSSLDDNITTQHTCRALLLDQDTLAQICAGDGGTADCVKYFGGNTTPFFCARGATPDGGT